MTPAQRQRKMKALRQWQPRPSGADHESMHHSAQIMMDYFDRQPYILQEFERRHGYPPSTEQRKRLLAAS